MLKLILKGIVIGVANIIPGVSGGTLAVILGIYEKLTEAIGNFFIVSRKEKIEYIKFLIQIAIGAVIGIILFSKIITYSVTNYPKITAGIFTLLIIPSIPFITKGEDKKNIKNIIFFIIGVLFSAIFIYTDYKFGTKISNGEINTVISNKYLVKLFCCGGVAAGAMIVPGISGSMLLLILGEYYHILGFINNFFKKVLDLNTYSSINSMIQNLNLMPLIAFSLGVIVGLIVIAKIINYLLEKHRSCTLFFITGIVVTSIIQIWLSI